MFSSMVGILEGRVMSLFSTWIGGNKMRTGKRKTCPEKCMCGFCHECFANVVKDPFKKCFVGCSEEFLFMLPCTRVTFQSGLLAGFPLLLLKTLPQVFTLWYHRVRGKELKYEEESEQHTTAEIKGRWAIQQSLSYSNSIDQWEGSD